MHSKTIFSMDMYPKVELSPMATPLVSDQKKRAMEALERRFAADKARSLQEEQRKSLQEERREEQRRNKKSRRNPKEDQQQVAPAVEGQVEGVPYPKIDPSPSSSSKKGRLVYTGHAPPGENADPAYARLSHLVHENLVGAVTEGSSNVDVVDNVVFNLLQHGDKGLKYTRGSIDMKIDKGLLLDNFVPRGGSLADARVKALKSHSKRSKKHMSMRQHRECGSFDLPKEFHSFSRFKPMHEMWKEYITELLKVSREKQLAQCLLMADLHGAFLQVVECKQNVAFKGASGIMIRETAETFGIITQEDKFRVVPKRGSVFIFQGGCWKITLYGDKLSLRNNATT
ncbi:uncharacterized protein M6B38_184200 [Iris pallida]|uniref:Uncharacterized protein n=1 Tax=Iris pallida TaxID=29817 RepID=A0AAX6ELH1_IRIPA|nr:uncharacterized protein M6B38_184200 [Iris pallida]